MVINIRNVVLLCATEYEFSETKTKKKKIDQNNNNNVKDTWNERDKKQQAERKKSEYVWRIVLKQKGKSSVIASPFAACAHTERWVGREV